MEMVPDQHVSMAPRHLPMRTLRESIQSQVFCLWQYGNPFYILCFYSVLALGNGAAWNVSREPCSRDIRKLQSVNIDPVIIYFILMPS